MSVWRSARRHHENQYGSIAEHLPPNRLVSRSRLKRISSPVAFASGTHTRYVRRREQKCCLFAVAKYLVSSTKKLTNKSYFSVWFRLSNQNGCSRIFGHHQREQRLHGKCKCEQKKNQIERHALCWQEPLAFLRCSHHCVFGLVSFHCGWCWKYRNFPLFID